ncbi:MAG: hypothetical protein HY664_03305 [Chloroflexi bacterium]|nr:hypothetical protein [Chloroflexota bacterium]
MIRFLYRLASVLLMVKVFSSGKPQRIGSYLIRRQSHKAIGKGLRRWLK